MSVLTAIVGGATYILSDGALTWRLAEDGLGMAEVDRVRERGPLQHGVTDLGFRLEPRTLQLVFWFQAATLADMATRRAALLRIFKPGPAPIMLRYALDNGDIRQIDCHYAGEMSLSSQQRFGLSQRIGVALTAPDPTWYDPTPQTTTFGIPTGAGFAVPMTVPVTVGASTLNAQTTIAYTGSWESYPTIRVTGPITNPRIENTTTGELLEFPATTIASGAFYDIDLRYAYKTVLDSAGANRIGELSQQSDLTTWHLASAEDGSASRDNIVKVTGSGITAATLIALTYDRRYVGI